MNHDRDIKYSPTSRTNMSLSPTYSSERRSALWWLFVFVFVFFYWAREIFFFSWGLWTCLKCIEKLSLNIIHKYWSIKKKRYSQTRKKMTQFIFYLLVKILECFLWDLFCQIYLVWLQFARTFFCIGTMDVSGLIT